MTDSSKTINFVLTRTVIRDLKILAAHKDTSLKDNVPAYRGVRVMLDPPTPHPYAGTERTLLDSSLAGDL